MKNKWKEFVRIPITKEFRNKLKIEVVKGGFASYESFIKFIIKKNGKEKSEN